MASLMLLAACAGQGDARTAGLAGAAAPTDTLARIHALVGTPSCSADSQCRTVAIGARPCGGPEAYLAYSTVHSPEAELRALAASQQDQRRKANAQDGRASDCRFTTDPGAVCRAGICVLGADQPVAR